MLINGRLADSSDGKTMEVWNPASGELLDTVPMAVREDVELAIDSAVEGQKEWAEFSVWKRGEILKEFAALVRKEENLKELAALHCRECGKVYKEAYAEINRAMELFISFSERARHLYNEAIPPGLESGHEHTLEIIRREPVGVVVCIVPYNYPISLMAHKVAPALAAGNSVVIKPASDTPLTTIRIAQLMIEAGVPARAVQVVTGSGSKLGKWLVDNPKIGKVSLTGSTSVGITTAVNAAPHLIPCTLELGGNDPFIVMDDGDIDLAVRLINTSRMKNAGQTCCSAKRLFVHKNVKEEFLSKLTKMTEGITVGDPMDSGSDMGCLINEKQAMKVEEQVNLTISQGAHLVRGGKRNGAFFEPTILNGVTEKMDICRDMEVFGPVLPVIEFTDLKEAVRMANLSMYGLSAAIITKSMENAVYAAKNIQSGGVVINGGPNAHPTEQPFGGYKASGIGNEGVMVALQAMTKIKAIILYNMV